MASIMAGASGYLLKNMARAGLLDAVRSAARGESLLDPAGRIAGAGPPQRARR